MAIIIMVPVALIMLCIGVHQMRSRKPVAFFSGEKPPKEEELTNLKAWNKKHGIMWVVYGLCIIAGWYLSSVMNATMPLMGGVFIPLPCMVIYHNVLVRKYIRKQITHNQ